MLQVKKKNIITIGTFDGVHLGHQIILKRIVNLANIHGLTPCALTLFPHPRMVLEEQSNLKLLNTIAERKSKILSIGIKNVVVKTFNKDFAALNARDFIKEILVDELNTKIIVVGYDHRFGKNRKAGIKDLKHYGKQFGFTVEEISAKEMNHVVISSTKIRKALEAGDITTANSFLGYAYTLTGKVIRGNGIGRNISFPTANIKIEEHYKLIPKNGVYVVKTKLHNKSIYGMMNIGTNPTVNGKTQNIEVHIFNFNQVIYNAVLSVQLIARLRDEQKFDSLNKLKAQLQQDKKRALSILKNLK